MQFKVTLDNRPSYNIQPLYLKKNVEHIIIITGHTNHINNIQNTTFNIYICSNINNEFKILSTTTLNVPAYINRTLLRKGSWINRSNYLSNGYIKDGYVKDITIIDKYLNKDEIKEFITNKNNIQPTTTTQPVSTTTTTQPVSTTTTTQPVSTTTTTQPVSTTTTTQPVLTTTTTQPVSTTTTTQPVSTTTTTQPVSTTTTTQPTTKSGNTMCSILSRELPTDFNGIDCNKDESGISNFYNIINDRYYKSIIINNQIYTLSFILPENRTERTVAIKKFEDSLDNLEFKYNESSSNTTTTIPTTIQSYNESSNKANTRNISVKDYSGVLNIMSPYIL
jgi:hypothetical protein